MKSLVIGATGFIGRALFQELVQRGENVAGLMGKAHFDLTERKGWVWALAGGYDVVYMCAGVTGGSGALEKDPLSFVAPNILMHTHLFEAVKAHGIKKLVCLSSSTGYPDTEEKVKEEDYFTGDLHGAYFNPGHTRRFIERLGEVYRNHFDTVFLRPSVVYGPGDDFNPVTCHVIPALVRKVAGREDPITIWGNGENWRDGVYIEDMVEALILASRSSGSYNIASGEGMTISEILSTLTGLAGYSPSIGYDLSKPEMLKRRVMNTDKAIRLLGWSPKVMMKEGLAKTLEWYESQ